MNIRPNQIIAIPQVFTVARRAIISNRNRQHQQPGYCITIGSKPTVHKIIAVQKSESRAIVNKRQCIANLRMTQQSTCHRKTRKLHRINDRIDAFGQNISDDILFFATTITVKIKNTTTLKMLHMEQCPIIKHIGVGTIFINIVAVRIRGIPRLQGCDPLATKIRMRQLSIQSHDQLIETKPARIGNRRHRTIQTISHRIFYRTAWPQIIKKTIGIKVTQPTRPVGIYCQQRMIIQIHKSHHIRKTHPIYSYRSNFVARIRHRKSISEANTYFQIVHICRTRINRNAIIRKNNTRSTLLTIPGIYFGHRTRRRKTNTHTTLPQINQIVPLKLRTSIIKTTPTKTVRTIPVF